MVSPHAMFPLLTLSCQLTLMISAHERRGTRTCVSQSSPMTLPFQCQSLDNGTVIAQLLARRPHSVFSTVFYTGKVHLDQGSLVYTPDQLYS
jgi:hypothetical protein